MKFKLDTWKEGFVLFRNNNFLPLFFLKKNFKHCSLLLKNDSGFLFFDPLLGFNQISFIKEDRKKVLSRFRYQGYIILKVKKIKENDSFYFYGPFCTGNIKRILGIRKPFILTPYQLYKYLTIDSKK